MFTLDNGPKYWFIRGDVNKTLERIVSIHNKNCRFITKGSLVDKAAIQDKETAQNSNFNDITNKNNQVAKIEPSIGNISITTLSEELGLDEYDLTKYNVTIKILKNFEETKNIKSPFKLLISKSYRSILFGVISMVAAEYTLFYSTAFDASALEFGSTNINIIVFAAPQAMTYITL